MKKQLIYIMIPVLILSGCGAPTEEITEVEKTPFYITTQTVDELSSANTIIKNGTIVGAQAITVTSQVQGRVKSLPMQEGDTAQAGWTIVKLEDNTGTYSFAAQRAKAALNSAQSNYTSTQVSLDKAITDTNLAIQQAQVQYKAAEQNGDGSNALQIEQLEQQVKKAEFDYQTQLRSNEQTIANFIATAKNLSKDVALLYEQVRAETDKILGVSPLYRDLNDSYEKTLGAKNSSAKLDAETGLRLLINTEHTFKNISNNYTTDNLSTQLRELNTLLSTLSPVLDKTDLTLTFTEAGSQLSQTQLDIFRSTIDGLQAQVQGQKTAITQQINSINSFLSTYKQQEESLNQQVAITKQQVASTRSSLQDAETTTSLNIDGAQNSYTTAIKNKDATLSSIGSSIQQARVAYNEAQNQLVKFTVLTPIQGTIGNILVDVGQEVNPGTPLFTISSTNQQQVEISLSQENLAFAQVGQQVAIILGENEQVLSGSIQSISKTADQNLTYKTIINLDETVDIFGDVVRVEIPVRNPYPLIPINVVTILGKNEGIINTRDGKTIGSEKVRFGKIWGNTIEITSDLGGTLRIIISDISNFNKNKQILQEKS